MLPLNPEQSAHAEDNITERGLLFIQPTRYLNLDAGEYGHVLAHHPRRYLHLGPPTKVRPSLRGGMQRTRVMQDKNIRVTADDLTRPAHPGVNAKKALIRGQLSQDFPYTFGFFHTNIIT